MIFNHHTTDAAGIKGVHTFFRYDVSSRDAQAAENALLRFQALPDEQRVGPEAKRRYEAVLARLTPYQRDVATIANKIQLPWRKMVARRLAQGFPLQNGFITHCALGSSEANPESDTEETLGAEVFRKPFGFITFEDHITTVDFYVSTNDHDGTYEEFGIFVDAGDEAESGDLLSRLITGSWIKSDLEGLRVRSDIHINSGT